MIVCHYAAVTAEVISAATVVADFFRPRLAPPSLLPVGIARPLSHRIGLHPSRYPTFSYSHSLVQSGSSFRIFDAVGESQGAVKSSRMAIPPTQVLNIFGKACLLWVLSFQQ